MNARAQELIRSLRLAPHPEGGAFREIHRSSERVTLPGGTSRAASTAIYFLLAAGEISRWHRVAHDEAWHFYEGDPLELLWIDPDWSRVHTIELSPPRVGREPFAVVPAGAWQAARPRGEYALAGCTVAPGFEFSDWTLLRDVPEAAVYLNERFRQWEVLL